MSPTHRTPVSTPVLDPAARKTKRAYNTLSASAVGLELGISVIIGILIGRWLDTEFGTTPWLMVLFLILGVVAGFRGMLRAVRRVERAEQQERLEDEQEAHRG